MKKIVVGYQEATLDFAIRIEDYYLVYSFFDRSAVNVRSMAISATASSVNVGSETLSQMWKPDYSKRYWAQRYIETFPSGRDRITTAMVVSDAIGESCIITTKKNAIDDMYSLLMNRFTLPILKEWMPYIIEEAKMNRQINEFKDVLITDDEDREVELGFGKVKLKDLLVYRLNFQEDYLKSVISEGLKKGKIFITRNEVVPLKFENLDEYYEKYGDNIVSNLEKYIRPLSETNGYCSDYTATKTKRLFPAQGNGINALVARLNVSNYAICNMDMGTGKTLQALAVMDSYFNRKYMDRNNYSLKDAFVSDEVEYKAAVLCPGHLVDKWVAEAEEIYGMKAHAVTSLKQLIYINEHREEYSGKQLFVLSKDFSKLGDMQGPIPNKVLKGHHNLQYCEDCKKLAGKTIWKKFGQTRCGSCGGRNLKKKKMKDVQKGLICPFCGELLISYREEVGANKELKTLDYLDFNAKKKANTMCYHCGRSLWGSQVKNIGNTVDYPWIRAGYYGNKSHKTKSACWVYKKEIKEFAVEKQLDEDEYWISSSVGIRKYSPARYILKHMKNFFDFFIADEAHMYESEAAQGQAFSCLVNVSNKTLALTGTLSNGYSDGLFRLYWRLDPKKMKTEGYTYDSEGEKEWNNKYGVLESRVVKEEMYGTYNTQSRGKQGAEFKLKPGISPQLMKDFLFESVVQLQISELSEGLPELNEIIVSVKPEEEVVQTLANITSTLQAFARNYKCPAASSVALQYQLFYTDSPYKCGPIINPMERNNVILHPEDYSHLIENGKLLNKEQELVDIVKKELTEGRNCYIYVEKTGKSGDFFLLKRIKDIVSGISGAKPLVLESNTVTATKREAWLRNKVEKEGYNVIISNPRLVETGIDFIWKDLRGNSYNFPTLIFYQVGLRLDVLWQASRRHYRLIQKEECRTYYMVSENTMQLEVLELMARKQVAVSAIQGGEFSSRGLASMAKSVDPKIELARRLKEGIHSDASEVQDMLKAITKSGKKDWNCEQNLLISDVIGEIVEHSMEIVPSVLGGDLFDSQWDVQNILQEVFKNVKLTKKEKRKAVHGQKTFLELFE